MADGPALYLGKVGSTGISSGPHAHWEVMKDGKRFPLSKARKDIGQYLQFKLPNSQEWLSLYGSEAAGFPLNPKATLGSPMGKRNTGIPGASTDHGGEDYPFTEGTQLRFLGPGSVATHAGRGGAGNVSSLRTGPYELSTFHLSELPVAATTKTSDAAAEAVETTVEKPSSSSTRAEDIIKSFLYGAQATAEKPKSMQQELKEQLMGNLLSQALTPANFLSSYTSGDPYMSGFNFGSREYFDQFFS